MSDKFLLDLHLSTMTSASKQVQVIVHVGNRFDAIRAMEDAMRAHDLLCEDEYLTIRERNPELPIPAVSNL